MTIRYKWVALRKKSRISISEISRRTGISRNMVSLYENGKCDIGTDKLEMMIQSIGSELQIKTVE
jgi:transcriptional regulator with XRE-family HTH domain